MNPLDIPDVDPEEVIAQCVQSIQNQSLSNRLGQAREHLLAEKQLYDHHAANNDLHMLPQSGVVNGNISRDEMIGIYKRFPRKGMQLRKFYDRILSGPEHSTCPYCNQRIVATLDHFLAKTQFPTFAISPTNLIPACRDCNSSKGEFVSSNKSEQFIHPYFDRVNHHQWLFAEIDESNPPSFAYHVAAPAALGQEISQRIQKGFEAFGLAELFASHAARENQNINFALRKLYEARGPAAVQQHLDYEYQSRLQADKNSWNTSFYQAASQSNWYCDGGFAF